MAIDCSTLGWEHVHGPDLYSWARRGGGAAAPAATGGSCPLSRFQPLGAVLADLAWFLWLFVTGTGGRRCASRLSYRLLAPPSSVSVLLQHIL